MRSVLRIVAVSAVSAAPARTGSAAVLTWFVAVGASGIGWLATGRLAAVPAGAGLALLGGYALTAIGGAISTLERYHDRLPEQTRQSLASAVAAVSCGYLAVGIVWPGLVTWTQIVSMSPPWSAAVLKRRNVSMIMV